MITLVDKFINYKINAEKLKEFNDRYIQKIKV